MNTVGLISFSSTSWSRKSSMLKWARVGLPGMRDEPQRLVDFEKLTLQLVLEHLRLVRHAGGHPGLRLGSLGVDGGERAHPGQRNQGHRGGEDANQPEGLVAAPEVHPPATPETSRVLLKGRHHMIG